MRRLLTIGAVLAVATLTAAPVGAVPPSAITIDFTETVSSSAGGACEFDAQAEFDGSFTLREFYNKEGDVTRWMLNGSDTVTVTNLETGKFFTGHDAWTEIIDWEAGTDTVVGLFVHVNVPGAGIVFIDAGRLVVDLDTGELISVSGPHNFTVEGDFAALCAALSS